MGENDDSEREGGGVEETKGTSPSLESSLSVTTESKRTWTDECCERGSGAGSAVGSRGGDSAESNLFMHCLPRSRERMEERREKEGTL